MKKLKEVFKNKEDDLVETWGKKFKIRLEEKNYFKNTLNVCSKSSGFLIKKFLH